VFLLCFPSFSSLLLNRRIANCHHIAKDDSVKPRRTTADLLLKKWWFNIEEAVDRYMPVA
jgi:hypothetical protein